MKPIIFLLAGLAGGTGIGWYAGHASRPMREQILAKATPTRTRVDEAAQRSACLEAIQGIKILESSGKQEAIEFLAQQVASYNWNYAIKPTTNHDILILRGVIAELAKSNSIVAAEIKSTDESAQQGE